MHRSSSERLLSELRRELRRLGRRARRRTVDEARDHLLSAIADAIAGGASAAEAEERAVERFGEPALVAARLGSVHPRRHRRGLPALVCAAVLTGVFAVGAGPVVDRLAAPAAVAATGLPTPTNAQCAAAWNRPSNARWHAYAAGLGSTRAFADASFVGRLVKRRIVISQRVCVVKLWLERRPGHWQQAVNVFADWTHGAAVYGSPPPGGGRAGPRHVRQRTTIQFANARVSRDGALLFAGAAIP
jgi:hypothetical protein